MSTAVSSSSSSYVPPSTTATPPSSPSPFHKPDKDEKTSTANQLVARRPPKPATAVVSSSDADSDEIEPVIGFHHHDAQFCDNCGQTKYEGYFYKGRYQCQNCLSYDLCGQCYSEQEICQKKHDTCGNKKTVRWKFIPSTVPVRLTDPSIPEEPAQSEGDVPIYDCHGPWLTKAGFTNDTLETLIEIPPNVMKFAGTPLHEHQHIASDEYLQPLEKGLEEVAFKFLSAYSERVNRMKKDGKYDPECELGQIETILDPADVDYKKEERDQRLIVTGLKDHHYNQLYKENVDQLMNEYDFQLKMADLMIDMGLDVAAARHMKYRVLPAIASNNRPKIVRSINAYYRLIETTENKINKEMNRLETMIEVLTENTSRSLFPPLPKKKEKNAGSVSASLSPAASSSISRSSSSLLTESESAKIYAATINGAVFESSDDSEDDDYDDDGGDDDDKEGEEEEGEDNNPIVVDGDNKTVTLVEEVDEKTASQKVYIDEKTADQAAKDFSAGGTGKEKLEAAFKRIFKKYEESIDEEEFKSVTDELGSQLLTKKETLKTDPTAQISARHRAHISEEMEKQIRVERRAEKGKPPSRRDRQTNHPRTGETNPPNHSRNRIQKKRRANIIAVYDAKEGELLAAAASTAVSASSSSSSSSSSSTTVAVPPSSPVKSRKTKEKSDATSSRETISLVSDDDDEIPIATTSAVVSGVETVSDKVDDGLD